MTDKKFKYRRQGYLVAFGLESYDPASLIFNDRYDSLFKEFDKRCKLLERKYEIELNKLRKETSTLDNQHRYKVVKERLKNNLPLDKYIRDKYNFDWDLDVTKFLIEILWN